MMSEKEEGAHQNEGHAEKEEDVDTEEIEEIKDDDDTTEELVSEDDHISIEGKTEWPGKREKPDLKEILGRPALQTSDGKFEITGIHSSNEMNVNNSSNSNSNTIWTLDELKSDFDRLWKERVEPPVQRSVTVAKKHAPTLSKAGRGCVSPKY